MILTKRPERMKNYFLRIMDSGERAWSFSNHNLLGYSYRHFLHKYALNFRLKKPIENLWLGVTAENQHTAEERIPILLDTPAAKRFVSFEPLLELVDLVQPHGQGIGELLIEYLDWVIVGAETGHGARYMTPSWARVLRDDCRWCSVPFFFKKMSNKAEIPADLMIREFPKE